MTAPKYQSSAQDIENRLGEAFLRSCDDGRTSEFLDDYFLEDSEDWASEWGSPLIENGTKGKRTGRGGGGFPSGGTDDAARSANPLPPITNRGVPMYQAHTTIPHEVRTLQDITPNQKPQSVQTSPPTPLQRGGYDGGIEVGFEGKWEIEKFSALLDKLEVAKNQASEDSKSAVAEIGGVPVLVDPSGANAGMHYKYRFTFDGVTFFIHHNPPKHRQGVRIRYGATALINRSLFVVHTAVLNFLETLGFTVTQEKISRVDMQVMLECKTSDLVLPIIGEYAVAKTRKEELHRKSGRIETYTLGSAGRLELCIYDKQKELHHAVTSDPVKAKLMLQYCIGEDCFVNNRPITRIEFRLWRDALRAMKIDTVRDLQEHETALADWLTSHWFRILAKPKVRGHENTAAIHPLWLKVQEAFRVWFPGAGNDDKPVTWTKRERISCDPIPLIRQAAGCIASAIALKCGALPTPEMVWKMMCSIFEPFKADIFNRSVERAGRMKTLKGVELGIQEACCLDTVRAGLERFFMGLNERKLAG